MRFVNGFYLNPCNAFLIRDLLIFLLLKMPNLKGERMDERSLNG